MTEEKYYKVKAQCYVCDHISVAVRRRIDHVNIKSFCYLNDNDIPESQICEYFKPRELLESL